MLNIQNGDEKIMKRVSEYFVKQGPIPGLLVGSFIRFFSSNCSLEILFVCAIISSFLALLFYIAVYKEKIRLAYIVGNILIDLFLVIWIEIYLVTIK